MSNCW